MYLVLNAVFESFIYQAKVVRSYELEYRIIVFNIKSFSKTKKSINSQTFIWYYENNFGRSNFWSQLPIRLSISFRRLDLARLCPFRLKQ